MFGTLGGPELFLILVVALIVFGPRKLPDIGKSVGRMMAEFRKASNDFKRTIEDEVEAEKLREATRIDPPSWSASDSSSAAPALPAASPDRLAYEALAAPESPAPAATEGTATETGSVPASPDPAPAGSEGSTDGTAPPPSTVSRGGLGPESE